MSPITGGKAGSTTDVSKELVGGKGQAFPDLPSLDLPKGKPINPVAKTPIQLPQLPSRIQTGKGSLNDLLPRDMGGTATGNKGIIPDGTFSEIMADMQRMAQMQQEQNEVNAKVQRILTQNPDLAKQIIKDKSATTIGGIPVGYKDIKGNLIPFDKSNLSQLSDKELDALSFGINQVGNIVPGQPVPESSVLVSPKFLSEVEAIIGERRAAGRNVQPQVFNRTSQDLVRPLMGLMERLNGPTGIRPGVQIPGLQQYAARNFLQMNPTDLGNLAAELSRVSGVLNPNVKAENQLKQDLEK